MVAAVRLTFFGRKFLDGAKEKSRPGARRGTPAAGAG
ncbi:hypothetical protein FrEUN1fDRAFT_8099, partial [Parafrankia sp. EUN1f]